MQQFGDEFTGLLITFVGLLRQQFTDDFHDLFVEVGPGKVLMGLMRRIDRGARVTPLGDLAALEGWLAGAAAKGGSA